MGIKIMKNQEGEFYAKGSPLASSIGIFFAILLLIIAITGFTLMIIAFSYGLINYGSFSNFIFVIVAIVILFVSKRHAKHERIKKLDEAKTNN